MGSLQQAARAGRQRLSCHPSHSPRPIGMQHCTCNASRINGIPVGSIARSLSLDEEPL
jgi:hypothetical protein